MTIQPPVKRQASHRPTSSTSRPLPLNASRLLSSEEGLFNISAGVVDFARAGSDQTRVARSGLPPSQLTPRVDGRSGGDLMRCMYRYRRSTRSTRDVTAVFKAATCSTLLPGRVCLRNPVHLVEPAAEWFCEHNPARGLALNGAGTSSQLSSRFPQIPVRVPDQTGGRF